MNKNTKIGYTVIYSTTSESMISIREDGKILAYGNDDNWLWSCGEFNNGLKGMKDFMRENDARFYYSLIHSGIIVTNKERFRNDS